MWAGKNLMRVGFFLCIIFASIQGYKIYKYFELYPTTEYRWSAYVEPPDEFVVKAQMMNTAKSIVWVGLLFFVLFEVFSYYEKPDKHWVSYFNKKYRIKEKIEQMGDKFEQDE
jgi:hypothetical protein